MYLVLSDCPYNQFLPILDARLSNLGTWGVAIIRTSSTLIVHLCVQERELSKIKTPLLFYSTVRLLYTKQ